MFKKFYNFQGIFRISLSYNVNLPHKPDILNRDSELRFLPESDSRSFLSVLPLGSVLMRA